MDNNKNPKADNKIINRGKDNNVHHNNEGLNNKEGHNNSHHREKTKAKDSSLETGLSVPKNHRNKEGNNKAGQIVGHKTVGRKNPKILTIHQNQKVKFKWL